MLKEIFRRQASESREKAAQERRLRIAGLRERLACGESKTDVSIELATQLRELGENEEALQVLKQAISKKPKARLYLEYVQLTARLNRTEEAIAAAAEGMSLFPDCLRLQVREALLLPVIYENQEQIEYYRQRFCRGLQGLDVRLRLDTPEQREDALTAISRHNNFYLAYQMQNDRQLQERYAGFVHRIVAACYPDLVGAVPPPSAPGRIRLGYLSASLKNVGTASKHSVAKTFAAWISGRNTENFEIFVYNSSESPDLAAERPEGCDYYRPLPPDLREACETIRADRLDVLIFLDIGMSSRLTPLSCLRLAPVQCVTWGHPVTTGSPNIDFFLSSDLMEPPGGDAHYSEQLIRLPGIGMDYRKPFVPRAMLDCSRKRFGLRDDCTVYLCCQSTFKYLPVHDDIFPRIASKVPASQFVFLTPNSAVAAVFRRRLEIAFKHAGLDANEHCVLLARHNVFDYWALNLASDIFLDSLEWSGCNSTMEAIACRLPIVTLPGQFMRGRHTYAILTQLGVTETIATDKENFIDIAVRLGRDSDWRKEIARSITARESLIYSDRSSTDALEQFLIAAVREKRASFSG